MLSTIQPTRFRPLHTLTSVTASASASVADHSPPTAASTSPSPPRSQILSLLYSLISRHVTAVQLAESYLDRIRHTDPMLHSFLHVAESQVLQEARLLDHRIEDGESLGPLAGVLVGVKDNICTADMPSTGGSRILWGYRTAYDATEVTKYAI